MATGIAPPLIGLYFWIISNTRLHPRTVIAGERCQRGPDEVAAPSAWYALIAGATPGFAALALAHAARPRIRSEVARRPVRAAAGGPTRVRRLRGEERTR